MYHLNDSEEKDGDPQETDEMHAASWGLIQILHHYRTQDWATTKTDLSSDWPIPE